MGGLDERFGALRELMNRHVDHAHAREHEAWAAELLELVQPAYAAEPREYKDRWVPYMTGFGQHWGGVLYDARGAEAYMQWSRCVPCARLRLIGDIAFVHSVMKSPRAAQVEALVMKHGVESRELERLLEQPSTQSVRELSLESWPWGLSIGSEGASAIARAFYMKNLEMLSLDEQGITNVGLEALAASENIASLRRLSVFRDRIGDTGARALAESRYVRGLEELSLGRNRLSAEGVQALVDSEALAGLRRLSVESLELGDDGALAIAGAKVSHAWEFLMLTQCGIGPEGAAMLAASEEMVRLEHLFMGGNPLGDEGVIALMGSSWEACRGLDLSRTECGDAGALAIARTHAMRHVRFLNLTGNLIGDEGAQALAASPHLDDALVLHMDANPLGARSWEALGERFGVKPGLDVM